MTTLAPALREFSYGLLKYRRTWRGSIVIGLVNPLLFLTGIGIIGKLIDNSAGGPLGGVPYLTWLAPGLMAASAMQMGFGSGGFSAFRSAAAGGSYRAASATVLSPTDIMWGGLLFVAFRLGLLSLGFFVVQVALGAAPTPWSVFTVPAAVLTGLAFAAPMAAWGVVAKRFQGLQTVFRFVVQPLYLLSGTFFPLSTVPGWLQKLAMASPLWHGVELCRDINLGRLTLPGALAHGGFLAAMTAIGIACARVTYRRKLYQ
ncbi:MAG: ABC-type multidrug transport system, permease component [Frankiales bacterium]|nr:ABC-type multidrug transport system, permease component [Frankiales bacterium]